MDRCPNELLMEIASFACTDGGYTGRSLCLVSRRINLYSEPFRFQSILLLNIREVVAFSNLLDSKPPRRRVVRNLCMSIEKPPVSPSANEIAQSGNSVGQEVYWEPYLCPTVAMTLLLAMVTRYIQILTIITGYPANPSFKVPEFPDSLPMLKELHIYAPFGHSGGTIMDSLPNAKRLTRLHLVEMTSCLRLPPNFVASLSHLYPHLTHMRILGLRSDRCGVDFIPAIEKLVQGEAPTTSGSGAPTASFPSPFLHLFVIPETRAYVYVKSTARSVQRLMMDKLRELALEASDSHRFVLPYPTIPHRSEYIRREYGELEKWWLDRVSGGEGCWAIPSAEPQGNT